VPGPGRVNGIGLVAMGVGAVVLAGSVLGALGPTIPAAEQRAFRAVNRLPGWLYVPLWLPMQLGNLVVGPAIGLMVALVLLDLPLAVAVVAATLLKLVAERVLRHRMARHLEIRQRPGTSEPEAVLRGGDVPVSGPSFPSGHVILVAAIAIVVVGAVPAEVGGVALVLTALVMLGRVYVGAHNPLDVSAGLGAGLVVGGLLAAVLR